MKCRMELDKSAGICTVTVTGVHRRPEDSHEVLRRAGELRRRCGCSRFLFDMRRADIQGGTLGAFHTAKDPERQGFSLHNRVAAVYESITEDHRFLEDVAVNRGASAFRVFDDMEKARRWLLSG